MNTEIQINNNESVETSEISSLPLLPLLPRVRPARGLSRMACLTERQLEHINSWLDDAVPYREIVKLCQSEWQVEIPLMTISRYNKRSAARILIKDLAESKKAAAEISRAQARAPQAAQRAWIRRSPGAEHKGHQLPTCAH